MDEEQNELERFTTNVWRGHAPGLWLTLRIQLGSTPDAVQERLLGVIDSWLRIAEPVHRQFGFPCEREDFPAPQQIASQLPKWFIDDFDAYSPPALAERDGRFTFIAWLSGIEERCWNWWGYERIGDTLIVQLQVDGWPCPTEELAYLARAAAAERVDIDS